MLRHNLKKFKLTLSRCNVPKLSILLNFKLSFLFCIFEDGFLETRNVGEIVKGLWRWRNLISGTGEAPTRSSIPFRRWQCQRGVALHSISLKLEKRWRANDDVERFVERSNGRKWNHDGNVYDSPFFEGHFLFASNRIKRLHEWLKWYFVG